MFAQTFEAAAGQADEIVKVAQAQKQNAALTNALPTELQYTGRSIEFPETQEEIYQLATIRVLPRLHRTRNSWAVVLDVDDTVLGHYEYQKRLAESGQSYSPATWDKWVREEAAPAVPGAKDFVDQVRAIVRQHRGRGRIVYITDRDATQDQATIDNLVKDGLFDPKVDVLLTKKDKTDTKEIRRACVEKGNSGTDPRCQGWGPTEIVALFGDSFRDFLEFYGRDVYDKGAAELDKGMREGRCFVIPNPMYGQWADQGAAGAYEHFKPKPNPQLQTNK